MVAELEDEFIHGVFLKEIKNRFLCLVRIQDTDTVCYIPSSCRLSNFLNMTGRSVLLKPNGNSNSRTQYAVYAVKVRRGYVIINLSEANRIIQENIKRRFFSKLGPRDNVRSELLVEGYKTDLFIQNTKTIIEIKSLLAFDHNAIFPSIYSERALKQLSDLSHLISKGYKVCYIFVALTPCIDRISINKDILSYYNAFSECVKKGMSVIAVNLKYFSGSVEIKKSIDVIL